MSTTRLSVISRPTLLPLLAHEGGVSDHYTIEATLRFEDVSGWRKILDFKGQASDNGLYAYNGRLQFYAHEPGGDFQAGQSYRIRLQRDRATKKVSGFLNDVLVTESLDLADDAVIQNERLILLMDDTATMGEEGSGEITRLRIWEGVITRYDTRRG